MFFRFIQPCHPQRATTVPTGDDWQHEIKFDGFRVQIHKLDDEVELYSRSGGRFSHRFPNLCDVLRALPAKSAIIDGEIVASDAAGMPNFWRLFLRSAKPAELHVWAFDLLALAEVVAGSPTKPLAGPCGTVRLPWGLSLRKLR